MSRVSLSLVALTALIAGCGDDAGSGPRYDVESGTYRVVNVTASNDACACEFGSIDGDEITLTASATTLAVDLGNVYGECEVVSGLVRSGNSVEGERSIQHDHSDFEGDCYDRGTTRVSGRVTSNDTIEVTLEASIGDVSGDPFFCEDAHIVDALPCSASAGMTLMRIGD
jgi:hypothetical protein